MAEHSTLRRKLWKPTPSVSSSFELGKKESRRKASFIVNRSRVSYQFFIRRARGRTYTGIGNERKAKGKAKATREYRLTYPTHVGPGINPLRFTVPLKPDLFSYPLSSLLPNARGFASARRNPWTSANISSKYERGEWGRGERELAVVSEVPLCPASGSLLPHQTRAYRIFSIKFVLLMAASADRGGKIRSTGVRYSVCASARVFTAASLRMMTLVQEASLLFF